MTDTHLSDDRVLGLAALPPGDPEREAAYAHARSCPPCGRALGQSEEMLRQIDAVPPPPAPSADVLERVCRPIRNSLAARAVPWRWLSALLVALWLMLILLAKRRAGGSIAWIESVALLGVAVACIAAYRRLGGRVALMAFAGSALLVGISFGEGSLAARVGAACLLTELGAAVLPFAVTAKLLIRRKTASSPAPMVVAAVAGALVAQAALHLSCPERTAGLHLAVFHLGGVALAALVARQAARLIVHAVARELDV